MGKKVEVSYNPQLGYLQTIFHHNFDFLTGIKSYTERTDGVEFVVDTYKENTVKVFIQCVGETAFRFRMYTPGNEHPFDNSIYQLEGQNGVNITENEEFISISKGKIEARVWGRSGYAGSHTIPAAWAGDSSTHLNNHACILRGGLSASMSGIPFWGFDMGGFYNTDHEGYECVPTDEEYIRSCQFGFFNSLSRCHGKTPREPWNFGEKAEKIFKKFYI